MATRRQGQHYAQPDPRCGAWIGSEDGDRAVVVDRDPHRRVRTQGTTRPFAALVLVEIDDIGEPGGRELRADVTPFDQGGAVRWKSYKPLPARRRCGNRGAE